MYSVSDYYKSAIYSLSRKDYWFGTITATDGTTMVFDTDDILQSTTKISKEIVTGNELQIGTAGTFELDMTIKTDFAKYATKGAEIEITYRLFLDDTGENYEDVPLGIFVVDSAETGVNAFTKIIAYDYMSKFKVATTNQSGSRTPYAWLSLACTTCGVTLGMSQADIEALPNGTTTLSMYAGNSLTSQWLDIVKYLAEVLCSYAYIGRDGTLLLGQYGATVSDTLDGNTRFDSSISDYQAFYTSIALPSDRTNASEIVALDTDDGLLYQLSDNPFLQFSTESARTTAITNILNSLAEVVYTPFTAAVMTNPAMDCGDTITIDYGDSETYTGAVMYYECVLSGKCTIRSKGLDTTSETAIDKRIAASAKEGTSNALQYYQYTNDEELILDQTNQKIIDIEYMVTKDTLVEFKCELLGTMDVGSATYEDINFYYYKNRELIESWQPTETSIPGNRIINLYYPIESDSSTEIHRFQVYADVGGDGTFTIGANQLKAVLVGQNLSATEIEFSGYIECEDTVPLISLGSGLSMASISESLESVTILAPTLVEFTQTVGTISLGDGITMPTSGITEEVKFGDSLAKLTWEEVAELIWATVAEEYHWGNPDDD